MMPRGGPTHPPRITEHGAPGGSDPPPGIAERWHRNLPSLAKERNLARHNPGVDRLCGAIWPAVPQGLWRAPFERNLSKGTRSFGSAARTPRWKVARYLGAAVAEQLSPVFSLSLFRQAQGLM